jgi:hypothetical protein
MSLGVGCWVLGVGRLITPQKVIITLHSTLSTLHSNLSSHLTAGLHVLRGGYHAETFVAIHG